MPTTTRRRREMFRDRIVGGVRAERRSAGTVTARRPAPEILVGIRPCTGVVVGGLCRAGVRVRRLGGYRPGERSCARHVTLLPPPRGRRKARIGGRGQIVVDGRVTDMAAP